MKHISLLVPKGGILGSIEGPRQLLTQVNHFFTSKGAEPLFKLQLVGLTKTTPLSGGLFTANADLLLHEVSKTDLIIVPAVDGDLQKALEANADFIPWISKHYKAGAEVASLCMGAFILASTGLLDGRKCATHWLAADQFRKMFPEVNLIAEKVRRKRHDHLGWRNDCVCLSRKKTICRSPVSVISHQTCRLNRNAFLDFCRS